jgi:carbonic anhydrase/acetyltransferase-like protein (isoleucine patch superfamily)
MSGFGPLVDIDAATFVHPSAQFYGKVQLSEGVSVWPNVVARAECFEIVVGPYSNIQDFVLLHVGSNCGTHIGAHCSITHHCTIHGARIGDNCLIGINATIMDGAIIGENSIIGGHTIVPEGKVIPPNSVVTGVPGKVQRSQDNFIGNRMNAFLYHQNGLAYAQGEHRVWDGPDFAKKRAEEIKRLEELSQTM